MQEMFQIHLQDDDSKSAYWQLQSLLKSQFFKEHEQLGACRCRYIPSIPFSLGLYCNEKCDYQTRQNLQPLYQPLEVDQRAVFLSLLKVSNTNFSYNLLILYQQNIDDDNGWISEQQQNRLLHHQNQLKLQLLDNSKSYPWWGIDRNEGMNLLELFDNFSSHSQSKIHQMNFLIFMSSIIFQKQASLFFATPIVSLNEQHIESSLHEEQWDNFCLALELKDLFDSLCAQPRPPQYPTMNQHSFHTPLYSAIRRSQQILLLLGNASSLPHCSTQICNFTLFFTSADQSIYTIIILMTLWDKTIPQL